MTAAPKTDLVIAAGSAAQLVRLSRPAGRTAAPSSVPAPRMGEAPRPPPRMGEAPRPRHAGRPPSSLTAGTGREWRPSHPAISGLSEMSEYLVLLPPVPQGSTCIP